MAEHEPRLAHGSHPGPVCLQALRITLGRTPLWLVAWSLVLLLAMVGALPWLSAYRESMDHRYEPGTLVGNLSAAFRFDASEILNVTASAGQSVAAALALLAMLLGVFIAGGWLQVFLERTGGHSLQRFFLGGSRYFFRFFRLLLGTLLTLHIAGWLVYGLPWTFLVEQQVFGIEDGNLEVLASEALAARLSWVQSGLYAMVFGLVMCWGDYTRTRLALHDTSSSFWAGLCTWFLIARHPVRTLRPMLGLFAIEVVILTALGVVASDLEGAFSVASTRVDVAVLFALVQAALAWSVITRGARYQAAVEVSKQIVRPIARPDPWRQAIGGPGGPRYPISGGDEYGIAL